MKHIALGLFALLVCGCRSDSHREDRWTSPVAAEASMTQGDTRLASEVRRAIASESALSYDARNVSVLADGGRITLRGNVRTAEEKRRVEEIARSCAGVSSVNNELRVRP